MQNLKPLILPPRLKVIADKVPCGSKVADIGTDHAYIPIYLIQKRIAKFVIASDIRIGPVKRAINNVGKYQFENMIDIRVGNGLEGISINEVDTVIIAGMGGMLICDILTRANLLLRTVKRLILQPMTGHKDLRLWLSKNSFTIIDEELVIEGVKLYNVIVAEHGLDIINDEIYYCIGKKLIDNHDPLLKSLLDLRINEQEKIINEIHNKNSENSFNRIKECTKRIMGYKNIYKDL